MTDVLATLSLATGLAEADLMRIVQTAPKRYKTFEIPKRNGEMREIAQPARELKLLQRILVDTVLKDLPVHDAARAYRAGMSIKDNANDHAGSGPILKMDFQNFFPSIRSIDWISYCASNGILDNKNCLISCNLLFRRARGERLLKLSIGAPSSPILSNILLFDFDNIVSEEAKKRGITYTRYADDLTFSGQRIGMLKDMLQVVSAAARTIRRPRLRVNAAKTHFITAATRRVVTGLVLSNDGAVSLGHSRKRLISAKVHHALKGKLTGQDLISLAGELAFANMAEPQFLEKLRKKYGGEIIDQIKSTPFS
jgi:RNA-directed DNA polymerase